MQAGPEQREEAVDPGGRAWLAASLLVGLAATLPCLSLLGAGFLTYDDPHFITLQPVWTSPGWRALLDPFLHPIYGAWHPLHQVSYGLDRLAWGPTPVGLRVTQLLLHATCAALVVALARRLGGSPRAAALAGLVFAWHPAHLENVGWLSQRKDLLSTAFGLGALIVWLGPRPRRLNDPRAPLPGWGRVVAATALLTLGLLSKSVSGVVLPWLAVLAWVRGALPGTLLRLAPASALCAVALVIHHHAQATVGAVHAAPPPLVQAELILLRLGYYARCAVLPWGLAPEHAIPPAGQGWADGLGLLAAAIGLAALSRRVFRDQPRAPVVYGLWFAAGLLPIIGLVPFPGYVADRYLLLPSAPLALLLAGTWARTRHARAGLCDLLAGLLLLAWCMTGLGYAHAWRDDLRLWAWNLAASPRDPAATLRLAQALYERGQAEEAGRLAREALARSPADPVGQRILANLALAAGEPDRAREALLAALTRPSPAAAPCALMLVALELGEDRVDAAARACELAALMAPAGSGEVAAARGAVALARGEPARAAEAYARAVETLPEWADAWARRALCERLAGLPEQAARSAERAGPARQALLAHLALDAGRTDEAARWLAGAEGATLESELARVRLSLAREGPAGARDRLRALLDRCDPGARRRVRLEPDLRPLLPG